MKIKQHQIDAKSAFKTYRNASLGIASGVWTYIGFDTEEFDVAGDVTSGVFVAPVTGIYHFDAQISFSNADNQQIVSMVRDRSQELAVQRSFSADSSSDPELGLSTDAYLTAGQELEVRCYQNHGSTRNLNLGIAKTWFSGHLIKQYTKPA